MPKANLLLNYASIQDPDLFLLTETWLDDSVPSSLFCPPAYVTYRCDRCAGRGGGTAILVKQCVFSKPVAVFPHTVPRNRHVEAVACQVSLACGQ